MKYLKSFSIIPGFLVLLSGCAGLEPFPMVVVPGQTIAVATGWKQHFSEDGLLITMTPEVGATVTYGPGNPGIRAVMNLYPDPLSWISVATAMRGIHNTGIYEYSQGESYANIINTSFTNHDKDWWQTTVFFDLPTDFPTGAAEINMTHVPSGETYGPISMQVIPGNGLPSSFWAEGGTVSNQLYLLERGYHYTIRFQSTVNPRAIQAAFTHEPDFETNPNGVGKAFVVNPPPTHKKMSRGPMMVLI